METETLIHKKSVPRAPCEAIEANWNYRDLCKSTIHFNIIILSTSRPQRYVFNQACTNYI